MFRAPLTAIVALTGACKGTILVNVPDTVAEEAEIAPLTGTCLVNVAVNVPDAATVPASPACKLMAPDKLPAADTVPATANR